MCFLAVTVLRTACLWIGLRLNDLDLAFPFCLCLCCDLVDGD